MEHLREKPAWYASLFFFIPYFELPIGDVIDSAGVLVRLHLDRLSVFGWQRIVTLVFLPFFLLL